MNTLEFENKSSLETYRRAAIDMASAYAADSYLHTTGSVDPWSEQCFVTLIDSAIDHPEFVFPQATRHSLEHTGTENLPEILLALKRNEIICPFTEQVAGEITPGNNNLANAFREFKLFALRERSKLAGWIEFHEQSQIKYHHEIHVPGGVQPFVLKFWAESQATQKLVEDLGMSNNRLRYAFDVFFRGQQYDEILSFNSFLYFNHPLRTDLFLMRDGVNTSSTIRHSWGRLLVQLIRDRQLGKRIDEVVSITEGIRTNVQRDEAA